jgi:hypothetical protein
MVGDYDDGGRVVVRRNSHGVGEPVGGPGVDGIGVRDDTGTGILVQVVRGDGHEWDGTGVNGSVYGSSGYGGRNPIHGGRHGHQDRIRGPEREQDRDHGNGDSVEWDIVSVGD